VDGFHGDSAVTVPVGEVDADTQKLLDVTSDALSLAIDTMVPGKRLSDIGHAVQERAESEGYSVVRVFAGHGIGRKLHEPPWIPNYGAPNRGPRLMQGMVLAIEPMVNAGRADVKMLDDEWTAVTMDGSLSAHFEHTILVSEDGPDVLTRIEGSH
jgi:methionyl aminopeptidase